MTRKELKRLHGFYGLILALLAASLVTACDSGGGQSVSVPIDDSNPVGDPVQGTVSVTGGLTQLTFSLPEDTSIVGLFELEAGETVAPVTIVSLPQSGLLTLRLEGQAFSYSPDPDFAGTDEFAFVTRAGERVLVNLRVLEIEDAPELTAEIPEVAEQGRVFSVNLIATDADGDDLTFTGSGLPSWLVLDSQTGLLSGVPLQEDIGSIEGMSFVVTDDTGLTDEINDVSLEVIDINDAPFLNLSQSPEILYGRESVSFRTFPVDPDSDAIEVSVEPDPNIKAQVIGDVITLTAADVDAVTPVVLAIRARDEFGAISRELLEITVLPRTPSDRGITVMGERTGAGVHVVLLGDGYADDQQESFREHVEHVIDHLKSDEGIAAHLDAFNIHRIETVSVDSGSDDRYEDDDRDTAYDSGYNCRSIPRLICANNLKVLEAALQEYPNVDQLILLVNDKRYGGSGNSGGSIAITSAFAPEIAVHEMGHSLADLADEYVDTLISESSGLPPFEEGTFPNVSSFSSPEDVPWSHWIDGEQPLQQNFGDSGVGVFEGGLYRAAGIYRPTFNSRMREFDKPFGPVNSEQWVLRLYTLTDGIRDFEPRVNSLLMTEGDSQLFSVSPIFSSEVQSVTWELNGTVVDTGTEPNELELSLPAGTHELNLTVADTSGVIRLSPPHAGVFTWTWSIRVR